MCACAEYIINHNYAYRLRNDSIKQWLAWKDMIVNLSGWHLVRHAPVDYCLNKWLCYMNSLMEWVSFFVKVFGSFLAKNTNTSKLQKCRCLTMCQTWTRLGHGLDTWQTCQNVSQHFINFRNAVDTPRTSEICPWRAMDTLESNFFIIFNCHPHLLI